MSEDLTTPDAPTCLVDSAQQAPCQMEEAAAEVIVDVPEGYLGCLEWTLLEPSTLLVEPAVDAEPHFDEEVQVADAGGDGSSLELEDVPGRQMPEERVKR